MATQAAVTFFYQSGFTAAVGKTLLIFSYWQEHVPQELRLNDKDLRGFNNIIVFVPRASIEHNDPAVWQISRGFPITYVAAGEAGSSVKDQTGVRLVRQGESLRVSNVQITAYGSTDAGVSFMVKVSGIHIFHAGDLNLWHWREESTLRQITQAENLYYAAVQPLIGKPIDVCMFPVDPRMGGMFEAGANHFIMTCKPRVFIPMHWQGRSEVATDFARRCRTKYTEGLALTKPRERAEITFDKNAINIHVYLAAEQREDVLKRRRRTENEDVVQRALDAFESGDPFAESDLPVDHITENQKKAE